VEENRNTVEPLESVSAAQEMLSFQCEGAVLGTWETPLPPSGTRAPCTIVAVDSLDRPIAGASVHVWGDDHLESGHIQRRTPTPVGPFEYTTDESGRCDVSPPSYKPRVRIDKAGVGTSRWVALASPSDASVQYRTVVVPVPPLARVLGQVRQSAGTPAASIQGVEARLSFFQSAPENASVTTSVDEQGRFELELPAEEFVALAPVVPELKTRERRFELTPGGVTTVMLWLPARWSIRGTVLSPEGNPVPSDAIVVSFWPEKDATLGTDIWGWKRSVHTDAGGRFEFTPPCPVRGRLVAAGKPIAGLAETPTVALDEEHEQIEVQLRACAPASIAGRVTGELGEPLSGAHVFANPGMETDQDLMLLSPGAEQLYAGGRTETREDGSFEIGMLHPDGLYTLRAWADDKSRVVFAHGVAPGRSDVVLAFGGPLEQVATVALVVSAATTETRVSAFRVTASTRLADGRRAELSSRKYRDTDGIASIEGQPLGSTIDILVSDAKGLAPVFLEAVRPSADGSAVHVSLSEWAAMDVEVRDRGQLAGWAVVEARRWQSADEDRLHSRGPARGRADENGRVRLSKLEPGHYTITAWHGGRSVRRTAEVGPGPMSSFELIELP